MKSDIAKRADKAKLRDAKYRDTPDIVVKVVCRYRAELFFKISRKTKLSRLFNAWTERMGRPNGKKEKGDAKPGGGSLDSSGSANKEGAVGEGKPVQFIFTHNGRSVEPDQTPEDMGMEDNDEILAVELMDLTQDVGGDEWDALLEPQRPQLMKNWTEDPAEYVVSLLWSLELSKCLFLGPRSPSKSCLMECEYHGNCFPRMWLNDWAVSENVSRTSSASMSFENGILSVSYAPKSWKFCYRGLELLSKNSLLKARKHGQKRWTKR
jgi:hypothetical protein